MRSICAGKLFLPRTRAPKPPESQRILDHRRIVGADPIGVLAHLQLGRALVKAKQRVKARTAYRDFLTLWKDADTNVPIFNRAKAEYVALQ